MKYQSRILAALLIALCFTAAPNRVLAQAAPPPATDQQQMQTIEDRWSEAIVKHDQFGLENTLSPQFVDISAQGEITTRDQQVARLFVKDIDILALSQKVVSTRVFGETALVTGTYTLRRKDASGTINEKGVFTHVFGRTRSGWLCLQSQRTAIVEQEAPRKAARKSSAEEPFHIPLFHKGAAPASTPPPADNPPPAPPASQPQ